MYPPPQGHGYVTDPEHEFNGGRGGGGGGQRGKRRRRGKRGGGAADYESDNNSVYSEHVPMQYVQHPRERSPGSVKSAPGGNRKGKMRGKNGKPLTGSWEDIRADIIS